MHVFQAWSAVFMGSPFSKNHLRKWIQRTIFCASVFCVSYRVLTCYEMHYNNHFSHVLNPFMPTVPTFAVRETDVSRHNGETSGAPLRDDSALRALSSLSGLRGAPEVPPLCRETSVSRTANVGTVGKNWLTWEKILSPKKNPTSLHYGHCIRSKLIYFH